MSNIFNQAENKKNNREDTTFTDIKKYLNNTITTIDKTVEEDLKKYFKDINNAYKQKELVFVLGSGVSVPYNIPDWKSLLQKLLLENFNSGGRDTNESFVLASLYPELFPNSPLISARYLEKSFNENQMKRSFEDAIKEVLYERVNRKNDSSTVKEILNYCTTSKEKAGLNCIITYNYDDILENALIRNKKNISYVSIFKSGMNPQNGELPIYHVHGYLPEKKVVKQEQMITLSESLYHKQYSDVYSWNNMVQINKFTDKTCVFIGLSLTDPNIRRLLDISIIQRGENPKNHYLIKKKYTTENMIGNVRRILQDDKKLLKKKGMANLELTETSEILLQRMEEFEELDAKSFGIKIIWINEFKEIAEILKRIRENHNMN